MPFNDNPYSQQQQQHPSDLFPSLWGNEEDTQRATSVILAKVFVRMFIALVVTAIVSFAIISSQALMYTILENQTIVIVAAVAQIGVVLAMSFGMMKMSAAVANILFFAYAALTGVVLSVVLYFFTTGVIFQAFAITALMFAAVAIYGTITKRDLTGLGSLLFMGLVGIIIASFVNILFFRDDMLSIIINYVGVVIFVGLTAYDTQRIKRMIASVNSGGQDCVMAATPDEAITKISVFGALSLYLNFINLFLRILMILGRRR
ncbi:MAG: Bax inhibitor-1/YccA family protein [Oscillospiraceae bacterium]|nr:Bax inhibitor-1/YccA family protein [Oscillospiraceae bacterium]MCL2279809.1 Bax inhibitor-1/YccA family protein [Oscillospiraceae bacterium]